MKNEERQEKVIAVSSDMINSLEATIKNYEEADAESDPLLSTTLLLLRSQRIAFLTIMWLAGMER